MLEEGDNEVIVKTTSSRTKPKPTAHPNDIGPISGETSARNKVPTTPIIWSFLAIGWLLVLILLVFLLHLYLTKRCKGNYQPTDTEESVLGSSRCSNALS
jgi:hypothetical protein